MICDEAAEHISALYDGETIPRAAAEHIGECEGCRAQLRDYMEIGAELRRVASLEVPAETPQVVWDEPGKATTDWWRRGWERMSIPRLVFASLVLAVVGLASSLAVVGVRANTQGTVIMLTISTSPGQSLPCALSTEDKKWAECGFVGPAKGGMLIYKIELLSKEGGRVKLGVRSKLVPVSSGTYSPSAVDDVAEEQYWFEPGQALQIEVPGLGPMAVNGEWMDHMPPLVAGDSDLDPGASQLRVNSPLLLRDSEVVGDLEGASASIYKPGEGVMIYWPRQGRYVVSLSPVESAVQGTIKLNRLSFQIDGRTYVIVTGTPITRSAIAWVRLEPNYKPSADYGNGAFIGSVSLSDLNKQPAEEQ